MNIRDVKLPEPPPNRVELTSIFGSLWFNSMAECEEYRAEPWFRKLFGMTKYQRRLLRKQDK